MASSSSRSNVGPVSLTEVRHEQRRVAALLRASRQIEVSFPPHDSIPFEDLYKSKFYRQLQAARSFPTHSRVPPLGHPLRSLPNWKRADQDHPLVSNKYGSAILDGDDDYSSSPVAALARSLRDGETLADSRRRAVGLKRSLSKRLPPTSGLLPNESKTFHHRGRQHASQFNSDYDIHSPHAGLSDDIINSKAGRGNPFSKYESLPGIKQSNNAKAESGVEYRLPRWQGQESGTDNGISGTAGPPHLQYNHGVAQPPPGNPKSISEIFSPTGWPSDAMVPDSELPQAVKHRHRKRKRKTMRSMATYNHDEVPFNSPESSSLSSTANSTSSNHSEGSLALDHGASSKQPRSADDASIAHDVDIERDLDVERDVDESSNIFERTESGSVKPIAPKANRTNSDMNSDDDPYGRAYVRALSVARSKAIQKDPFYLSHRLTRPFTFSFFCQKEVCTCGNCPKLKRKRGKTGFKAILGDVNMYDYFKWSKDGKT